MNAPVTFAWRGPFVMLVRVKRTVLEQAAEWRCGKDAVLDAIRSGELRAAKIAGRWLIEPADAEVYEQARTNRPPPRPRRRPRRRVL